MFPRSSSCPYVGLQPYYEEDWEYFFGRDRDQRIISANLYSNSLTILYGASGVGKSSVLNAGVVPKLRQKPRTAVVVFRNWQYPEFLSILKAECIKAVELAHKKPLTITPSLPLDELLFNAGQLFGGTILILLDQFEEYFVYQPESEVNYPFESEFACAINRPEVDANFLISLREDGLAKLDRFSGRIPNLMENTLRLQHLDAETAEEAIRKPLDVYNRHASQASEKVSIEDTLVHEILNQVRSGRVSLAESTRSGQAQVHDRIAQIETPFLQLVLERLWKAEINDSSHVLRLSTLEHLKGAKEIVRTHLDEVMNSLAPAEQESAARIFQHLVTPSGTKIAHKLTDLAKWANLEKDQLASILKKLSADNRILRPIAPPPDQPEELRYEVFHDVVAPAVLDWGTRYLQKMEQEEAERQREIERQRQLEFERERARAEEQARNAMRLRWLTAGLAVVVLLAISLGVFAWWKSEAAIIYARNASKAEEIARRKAEEAYSLAKIAEDEARAAREQREFAELARQKAIEQQELAKLERKRALDALGRLRLATDAAVTSFSRDGSTLVAVSPGREVILADYQVGKTIGVLESGSPINYASFSPDGKFVVTGNQQGTVEIWEAHTSRLIRTLMGHTASVRKVVFSPDAQLLGTASDDHTGRIWDTRTGSLRFVLSNDGPVTDINFSPDGRLVTTTSSIGAIRFWDVRTGLIIRTFFLGR